jgi:hypothetical protein
MGYTLRQTGAYLSAIDAQSRTQAALSLSLATAAARCDAEQLKALHKTLAGPG